MTDKYAGAVRPAPRPAEPLPPQSCDCHLHVFGDPARFPDRNPNPIHASREASWEDALRMHASVGFARGVLVQPANYTTDHSYFKHALQGLPREHYRAIGIIDESVSDAELARLNDAGMRGVRFNFVRMFKLAPSPRSLQHSTDRVRALGWYIKIFVGPEELPDLFETLRAITSVPVVIDHMARLRPESGGRNRAHRLVLDLLKRENFWVMLSNGARMSTLATRWDDVVPIGAELYAAAPDRCIFGTDWPHTHSHNEGGGPQEHELIELLYRYLPDIKARQAVLVDNPARLHGWQGSVIRG
jgi:predicted TIM-barrel fold metal-dependent hydrolase